VKFGFVPVTESEGAILAHSLRLPEGRLRKGLCLKDAHLEKLMRAGYGEVLVARLEPGDTHEDDAAQQIAQTLAQGVDHVHLSAPFTGRVNLIADRAGVVLLSADRIVEANMVDPMITIATVPENRQIHAGGMIATVKIISYAVPGRAVAQAASCLHGAVRLAVPRYRCASLIVTEVEGGPGDKGREAIEHRLNGLGMDLAETVICPHEALALARAIACAEGEIVLILTASATSDLRDTAPEALRLAGGEVTRFGIPVDPGNLLFLGAIGAKPVIGLPGSARSSVLHGADWVLARVACGVEITARDFAAMGVGGLLKEIPTRPQPRRATPRP
jgi:molybdenum cofactor cytidylyltransferase